MRGLFRSGDMLCVRRSWMTPAEFAAQHGLTLEEAEVILNRRQKLARVLEEGEGRVEKARLALLAAQKKVGVHPVVADGESLEKVYDPDADVGVEAFYKKEKPRTPFVRQVVSAEDESQDPKDYR